MLMLHDVLVSFLTGSGVDPRTAGLVAGRLAKKAKVGTALGADELALVEQFLAQAALGPQPEPPDMPRLRRLAQESSQDMVAFRHGAIRPPVWTGGTTPGSKPVPANKATSAAGASPAYVRQLAHAIARFPG